MVLNERRRQIITTGLQLFKEKGYDNVTVQDICNACSITKPTFYKYIANKEDLLQFYFKGNLELILHEMKEMEKTGDYWQVVRTSLMTTLDKSLRISPDLLGKYYTFLLHTPKVPARYTSDVQKELVKVIGLAQQKGQILNESDPATLAMVLRNVELGYTLKWAMAKGSFELEPIYETMIADILLPAAKEDAPQTQTPPSPAKAPSKPQA
jgi:AcrR family transcriptional regulator